MIPNKISVNFSQADQDAISTAIETIREKLPFLVNLTADEVISLPKMGARSQAFVDKALEVAAQNLDIMPRGFDVNEMRKDVEAFNSLTPIRFALVQLLELVENTQTLLGSEAYSGALAVYTQAKTTGKGIGLEAVVDELGRRFGRNLKPKTDNPDKPQ